MIIPLVVSHFSGLKTFSVHMSQATYGRGNSPWAWVAWPTWEDAEIRVRLTHIIYIYLYVQYIFYTCIVYVYIYTQQIYVFFFNISNWFAGISFVFLDIKQSAGIVKIMLIMQARCFSLNTALWSQAKWLGTFQPLIVQNLHIFPLGSTRLRVM